MNKAIVIVLFLMSAIQAQATAQDPYAGYREVDTISFPMSDRFYVKRLRAEDTDQPNQVKVSWVAHKSIKKFLVEIRDSSVSELFYRQIQRKDFIIGPANAHYTIMPLSNNLLGKPKTVIHRPLTAAQLAQQVTRKNEIISDRDRRHQAIQKRREQLKAEKELRGTVRLIVIGAVILGLAIFTTLVIFLVRYLTRHRDPRENRILENRDYSDGWE
ncbi:hypothetical protein [Nonlabens xiamenensis]|uniref:hypothetical protein n=1 Tax=Nonlabens xiamenensis TaxID=2341043 RepID=UPI000F60F0F7|nr:hypothetical protein [Nonlabens xiamenensis]